VRRGGGPFRVLTPTGETEIACIVTHRLFSSIDEGAGKATADAYGEYLAQISEKGVEVPANAMTPAYLAHQLRVSLEALQVARVDLFHLHNPEHQRPALGPLRFRAAMRKAFEACEEMAAQGLIGAYGCATWNGFRVPPGDPGHLSLAELLEDAEAVGGRSHRFRWLQLPLSLAMPEAFNRATQALGGRLVTPLAAAAEAGLQVQVSASLMQARLLAGLPKGAGAVLPGCATPAQAALQFASSCPGVTTALCGMSDPAHVRENLAVLALPRAASAELRALVG